MKRCINCGTLNPDLSERCSNCGIVLEDIPDEAFDDFDDFDEELDYDLDNDEDFEIYYTLTDNNELPF